MRTQDLAKLIDQYRQQAQVAVDHEKYIYYTLTYHSTAIEGSTLNEHEVMQLLALGKSATNKLNII